VKALKSLLLGNDRIYRIYV